MRSRARSRRSVSSNATGAKKDPEWNDRNKPDQVREKWVEMMNGAMERAGIEQRMDARSWAEQGRPDLAALVEPKLLGGEGKEARELRETVDELRRKREELPSPYLSPQAAAEKIEDVRPPRLRELNRSAMSNSASWTG